MHAQSYLNWLFHDVRSLPLACSFTFTFLTHARSFVHSSFHSVNSTSDKWRHERAWVNNWFQSWLSCVDMGEQPSHIGWTHRWNYQLKTSGQMSETYDTNEFQLQVNLCKVKTLHHIRNIVWQFESSNVTCFTCPNHYQQYDLRPVCSWTHYQKLQEIWDMHLFLVHSISCSLAGSTQHQ